MIEFNIKIPNIEKLPFTKITKPGITKFKTKGNARASKRLTNFLIPKKEGIYFLYNNKKDLVYIGETTNLFQRISTHRRKSHQAFFVKFFLTNYTKNYRRAIEQLLIDKFELVMEYV